MQTATNTIRKSASFIGEYISRDYYQYLIEGYDRQHPTEQKAVFIAKAIILAALDEFPTASGLRFLYGLRDGDQESSRTIVLMACNGTPADRLLPNLIMAPEGYLTNSGEKVSFSECWEMFSRYVQRMSSLMAELPINEIPRACFYGINSLRALLEEKECAGINYHFGYNRDIPNVTERYQAVLEAVNQRRESLGIFVDNGQLCPPTCIPGFEIPGLPLFKYAFPGIEGALEQLDGPLYELYHNLLPALIEAIQQSAVKESYVEVCEQQFAACRSLAGEGKMEEARHSFRSALEQMMRQYLFKN